VVLTRPFVSSVIIGAKTREQLKDNLAATDVRLSPEHVQKLDAASTLPLEYPGWMSTGRTASRASPSERGVPLERELRIPPIVIASIAPS
jgi:hypothetical protein